MPLKNISGRDFLQGSALCLLTRREFAAVTGTTTSQYALAQTPYVLIAAGITIAGYPMLAEL